MSKKKSKTQRLKAMEKKGSEGDLMDAYTDNPPPQPKVQYITNSSGWRPPPIKIISH